MTFVSSAYHVTFLAFRFCAHGNDEISSCKTVWVHLELQKLQEVVGVSNNPKVTGEKPVLYGFSDDLTHSCVQTLPSLCNKPHPLGPQIE